MRSYFFAVLVILAFANGDELTSKLKRTNAALRQALKSLSTESQVGQANAQCSQIGGCNYGGADDESGGCSLDYCCAQIGGVDYESGGCVEHRWFKLNSKERAVGVGYELETIARGNVCGDNQMAAATKEVCTRVAESMNLQVKVIAEKYFAAKYTSIPHGCYYKPYGSKGAAIFWMEKGEHFEFNIRYSGNFETNSKFIQMVCIPRASEKAVGGCKSKVCKMRCAKPTRPPAGCNCSACGAAQVEEAVNTENKALALESAQLMRGIEQAIGNGVQTGIVSMISTGSCPQGHALTESECQFIPDNRLGFGTWSSAGVWNLPETCGCFTETNGKRYFNRLTGSCNNPDSGERMICREIVGQSLSVWDPTISAIGNQEGRYRDSDDCAKGYSSSWAEPVVWEKKFTSDSEFNMDYKTRQYRCAEACAQSKGFIVNFHTNGMCRCYNKSQAGQIAGITQGSGYWWFCPLRYW